MVKEEEKDKSKVEKVDTAYKKVKFSYKLANFVAAVIALSWFFEGTRKIQEAATLPHILILIAGTVFTLFFLAIHSFWIYIEEKSKGNLVKRIALFEKILAMTEKQDSEESHGGGN